MLCCSKPDLYRDGRETGVLERHMRASMWGLAAALLLASASFVQAQNSTGNLNGNFNTFGDSNGNLNGGSSQARRAPKNTVHICTVF